jgi:formate hydrogenlyase subunit 3/multisubunit Na+/H+ antiporter MnhD subunit
MLSQVPRPALWLGFAGLLPFLAGTAGLWLLPPPWNGWFLSNLITYAATILSFLGAVHWGFALAEAHRPPTAGWQRLGWGVVPALVAWVALGLAAIPALITLIVGFAAVLYGDDRAARSGLAPAWYPALCGPLTALVVLMLAASLVRLLTGPDIASVVG